MIFIRNSEIRILNTSNLFYKTCSFMASFRLKRTTKRNASQKGPLKGFSFLNLQAQKTTCTSMQRQYNNQHHCFCYQQGLRPPELYALIRFFSSVACMIYRCISKLSSQIFGIFVICGASGFHIIHLNSCRSLSWSCAASASSSFCYLRL